MRKEQTTTFTSAEEPIVAGRAPACLVQIHGGELGRRVEVASSDITIGRDDDNSLSVEESTVSRRHARLFVDSDQYFVEDFGSRNGTFVNDVEIAGITAVRTGDLVRCGRAVFKFIEGGNIEALYHEEIHRLAITDGLTQTANKRHFTEFLEREISRAHRHDRPLSLIMFDVDHFKGLNDEFGHLAGDAALKVISRIVREQVRREELLARYGGEEFAIVLPETMLDGATTFAERLRASIETGLVEHDGDTLRVTISVGATWLHEDDSLESLVERVDTLLYQAKREGRNRVVAG